MVVITTSGTSNLNHAPWTCPRCARVNAPHVDQCCCLPEPVANLTPDCGCPPGTTCQSTACPRALKVFWS
jgi:hypothetical protein